MGMVLESDEPAAGDYSIYQVESFWVTQQGETIQLSSLAGHVQVLAMTYTSCEVSCPRIVASLKQIQASTSVDTRFVLLSIDPDRDTAGQLARYASKMELENERWTLLTGQSDDVLEMAALMGVRYRRMGDGEYAHSNMITVLDESGVIIYQQNGLGTDLTLRTIEFLNQ